MGKTLFNVKPSIPNKNLLRMETVIPHVIVNDKGFLLHTNLITQNYFLIIDWLEHKDRWLQMPEDSIELKNRKLTRIGNIQIELLQYGGHQLITELLLNSMIGWKIQYPFKAHSVNCRDVTLLWSSMKLFIGFIKVILEE